MRALNNIVLAGTSDSLAQNIALSFFSKVLQLDWPSETYTLQIDLPRDRKGYDEFEYTDENLSMRRIHWCGEPSSIVFRVFLRYNFLDNDNGAWLPAQLDPPHRKL